MADALAIQLADQLKERFGATVPTSQAAAELRRLHELNVKLVAAVQALMAGSHYSVGGVYSLGGWGRIVMPTDEAMDMGRAAVMEALGTKS